MIHADGTAGEVSLPRLPPGRHGLPREFVTRNQRDRLTAGVIAAVAEHGYQGAGISQIIASAGLSRRTFYKYFAGKRECFLAAYELVAAHLRKAASATADIPDRPARVGACIDAVLAVFAANPRLARFFLVAPLCAEDPAIVARHRLFIDVAGQSLSAALPSERRRPGLFDQALVAGLASVAAAEVEKGLGGGRSELARELADLFIDVIL